EAGECDGQHYFAMEFLEGGSLDQLLRHKPIPWPAAVRLCEALARAVHAAHQQNLIHRDLKPANVLLTHSERPDAVRLEQGPFDPRIVDFGLARDLGRGGLTRPGEIMGTASYMSPEQARRGGADRPGDRRLFAGRGPLLHADRQAALPGRLLRQRPAQG